MKVEKNKMLNVNMFVNLVYWKLEFINNNTQGNQENSKNNSSQNIEPSNSVRRENLGQRRQLQKSCHDKKQETFGGCSF